MLGRAHSDAAGACHGGVDVFDGADLGVFVQGLELHQPRLACGSISCADELRCGASRSSGDSSRPRAKAAPECSNRWPHAF